jgi:hypothetical protein
MRTQSPDTSPAVEAVQIHLLRTAGPARRLRLMADLTRMTRGLSWYGLCRAYPDAGEEELRYRWCALLYGEDLAACYIAAWRARSRASAEAAA